MFMPFVQGVSQKQVDALRWWHSIDFGGGIVSRGVKTVDAIGAEASTIFQYGVAGKSVLDVGAWDGAFSFEAERRGASRILATDHVEWGGSGWGDKRAFDLARRAFASRVEDMEIDVPAVSPYTVGRWDVVLLLGVLHFLEDMYSTLKRVGSIAREQIIVETATACNDVDYPVARFWPNRPLGGQANFWTPNTACLKCMLHDVGFSRVEIVSAPTIGGLDASAIGRHIAFGWR